MKEKRDAPIAMTGEQFRKTGYQLIDALAGFIDNIHARPVTTSQTPEQLQTLIGRRSLPQEGSDPVELVNRATGLLINHSLFNGHPKFLGYITSSPAPLGALADLLAAVINPNVGAQVLSPVATEIEKQTIQWLAELIGVPGFNGLLVSGGNMANITAYATAKTIKSKGNENMFTVYCPKTTHAWIEKAVKLFGPGTENLRWIEINEQQQMDTSLLEQTITIDIKNGYRPLMVVGTAGDVSTGAVDDLKTIAAICKKHDTWFHVDGAYGAPAAALPDMQNVFEGMADADSIALDPHKWLYSPLEAGCVLVKNPHHLTETFSSHPVYYNFDGKDGIKMLNYYEYGFQNSRGFKALKVWLALQQAGRNGYIKMIAEDIALSLSLYRLAENHPELEAVSQHLSITTLRYIPAGLKNTGQDDAYLNRLNEALLNELQKGGEVFLSNAVIKGKYCLRGCIVNFRTTQTDIHEITGIILREGRRIHEAMYPTLPH